MKNDQWGKVYIKMGLPDESSVKNSRLVENAYKKFVETLENAKVHLTYDLHLDTYMLMRNCQKN